MARYMLKGSETKLLLWQIHAWKPCEGLDENESHSWSVHPKAQAATLDAHIPQVGSWRSERKFEICQPIGDWVIEEFDSERNILLPWWWTRRNNIIEESFQD